MTIKKCAHFHDFDEFLKGDEHDTDTKQKIIDMYRIYSICREVFVVWSLVDLIRRQGPCQIINQFFFYQVDTIRRELKHISTKR